MCRRTTVAHDKMNGNYYKMHFAEKLLPNLSPQSVIVFNSASDQSKKKECCQESFGKRTEYKSGPRCTIYHKKNAMMDIMDVINSEY